MRARPRKESASEFLWRHGPRAAPGALCDACGARAGEAGELRIIRCGNAGEIILDQCCARRPMQAQKALKRMLKGRIQHRRAKA